MLAVARGGARDERVDVVGDAGLHHRGHRHVVVDVAVGHLDRRLALVGLAAGEQLVEDDAGGVDVRPRVGPPVDDQLGREVGHRADQHAAGRGVLGVGADGLGQAEVGDLDATTVGLVGDEHVLRLDVAVDQARAVGRGEGGDDRLEQRQRPGRRHRRLLADHVAQGVPGDVLHDEEDGVLPVGGVVALVVDAHHVGVVEPGGGAGLADEPLGELTVVAEAGVHDLDRDRAVEAGVGGLVDTGHATARDAGTDAVATVQHPADQGVAGATGRSRAGVLGWLHCSTSSAGSHKRTGKDPACSSYGSAGRGHAQARSRRGAPHPARHAQDGGRPSSRRRLMASTLST